INNTTGAVAPAGLTDYTGYTLVPLLPTVETITIDPVVAQAGRVMVLTDQLSGSGTFDVPRDSRISIINETHAFLIIEGAEIPDVNGGLIFNGTDVSLIGDYNGAITAENLVSVNKDNNHPDIVGVPSVGLITSTLNLTAASTTASGGDPTILIENDFDVVGAGLNGTGTGVWPDIIIEGDVLNLRGDILIDNNSQYGSSIGDIVINAEVNGKSLVILSGGTVSIGGGDEEIIYHNAGDPYSKWKTSVLTGDINNDLVAGTLDAERIDQVAIDAFLDVEPSGVSLEARKIFIDTSVININGTIKSGEDTYSVTLDSSVKSQIEALRDSGTSTVTLLNTNNNDFQIYYDPTGNNGNGKVIVTDLVVSGGYVDITGKVANTRNGKIIVNGGYPDIDIVNEMGFADGTQPEIVLQDLDATTRGDGELILKDQIIQPNGSTVLKATIYTVGEDGVTVNRSVDGVNTVLGSRNEIVNGVSTAMDGSHDVYNPQAGYRYGWTIAQANRTELIEEWTEGDWLGIDAFVPDRRQPDYVDSTDFPGELLPDSNYFYLDTSLDGDAYKNSEVEVVGYDSGRQRTGY
ncbi:MAG: hypothetical protein ABJJ37_01885, partial [Roseibium sp.]